MVNVRRVFVSLVAGSLLLVAVGAQASAVEVDAQAMAVAERGLALGLAAGQAVAEDAEDGVLDHPGSARAIEVLTAVMARLEGRENGRGPERAIEVHQALLEGRLPAMSGESDAGPPGLARAYGLMRESGASEGRGSGAKPTTP